MEVGAVILYSVVAALAACISGLAGVVGYLYKKINILQSEKDDCHEQLATVRSQLLALSAIVESSRQLGVFSPAVATVVVDLRTGLIVEWSSAATILTHWDWKAILGKPVTTLIPERFREAHRKVVADMVLDRRPPRKGPFHFPLLTKDGHEVRIIAYYSGWMEGSVQLVGATLAFDSEFSSDRGEGNEPKPNTGP